MSLSTNLCDQIGVPVTKLWVVRCETGAKSIVLPPEVECWDEVDATYDGGGVEKAKGVAI
ncbi:hypothetical protein FS749_015340 [Ceratobasidium sp. UAMH 11750]|nr:hypothetical protein FS749_015340 [Ceratobasidium sp. UAMH 11750]